MPLLSNSPSRILGGRSGLAVPVPSLGAELLTNGNMETGSPPTGWQALNGATVTRSSDQATGRPGNYSVEATRGTDDLALYRACSVSTAHSWICAEVAIKNINAPSASVRLYNPTIGNQNSSVVTATDWTRVRLICRLSTTADLYAYGLVATSGAARFDDFSIKAITLASMFSARVYSNHATTKARVTVTPGTRAGVVANLDSAASPANFVIASHDGTTARLTKCVAGTYTELVSAATAYVAGAFVEIRRLAGTDTWQLWYNGAQVGANQTISDAAIKSATLAGYFNTYAGNVLSEFSCVASA